MAGQETYRSTLRGTLRGICEDARSEERRKLYGEMRMMGIVLIRLHLAAVLHPIAAIRTTLMIGDEETQKKDWAALMKTPYPSFLKPREVNHP